MTHEAEPKKTRSSEAKAEALALKEGLKKMYHETNKLLDKTLSRVGLTLEDLLLDSHEHLSRINSGKQAFDRVFVFLFAPKIMVLLDEGERSLDCGDCAAGAVALAGANLIMAQQFGNNLDTKIAREKFVRKALQEARHARRAEAQKRVLAEWDKDVTAYRSAAKAGMHLADWLQAQGYSYEPRTVSDWIRSHAKSTGVRLR